MALVKFCAKCGKKTEKLLDGLCVECAAKRNPIIFLEKDKVKVFVCECGKISLDGKKWEFMDEDKLIFKILESFLYVKETAKVKVEWEYANENAIKVVVVGEENQAEQSAELWIEIKRGRCDSCSRMISGYYEATIQLRGSESFVEDMIDNIERKIAKSYESDDKAFITEVAKVKNGVDVKVGSNRFAKKFVREVKRYKNVETKYSKKLKTRKDGKNIYRFTYLIREVVENVKKR